ncbi:MAG: Histone transcription regulator 3 [Trizodia sp. TS-e1964]|nr:MAG: Histone transcription regulator 3 [Trizodia sp. TS-e1964]
MSAFTALNIIPDDDTDDEVDNTREVQIEEALKLYQNAIKLHSGGISQVREAGAAYMELFRSEIFSYPESQSSYQRLESDADGTAISRELEYTHVLQWDDDGAPSTLPQLLYLSYKNHGQFALDFLKHCYQSPEAMAEGHHAQVPPHQEDIDKSVDLAIGYFAEALDRDETDVELWRRTARMAGVLDSKRIFRYCTESALDAEGEGFEGALPPTGLEEAFAREELRDFLVKLPDELSLSQPPIAHIKQKRLAKSLKAGMNQYPFLPTFDFSIQSSDANLSPIGPPSKPLVIDVPAHNWSALGKALLNALVNKEGSFLRANTSLAVVINTPPASVVTEAKRVKQKGTPLIIPSVRPTENFASSRKSPTEHTIAEPPKTPVTPSHQAQEPSAAQETIPHPDADVMTNLAQAEPLSVPQTTKRNSSSAGLDDQPDGGRIRSKRIRARETNTAAGEKSTSELANIYENLLWQEIEYDTDMFAHAHKMLIQAGAGDEFGTFGAFQAVLADEEAQEIESEEESVPGSPKARISHDIAVKDFYTVFTQWNEEEGRILLYGDGTEDSIVSQQAPEPVVSSNTSLKAFLEHSKSHNTGSSKLPNFETDKGLTCFINTVHLNCLHLKSVALLWVETLLLSPTILTDTASTPGLDRAGSTYIRYLWPDHLKDTLLKIIVCIDDVIFQSLQEKRDSMLSRRHKGKRDTLESDIGILEMSQTLFELHLDIHSSLNDPSSEVDANTCLLQKDRLQRWARFAADQINFYTESGSLIGNTLELRFIWASALHASMADDAARDHVLLCFTDLKALLESSGNPVIRLENNAVMSEVSAAAAERELSRLTAMDLFLDMFRVESNEPVTIIETLEPILESCLPDLATENEPIDSSSAPETDIRLEYRHLAEKSDSRQEMIKFLRSGSTSLRLFLWQRLRSAYEAINYPPKVVSCYLRSIEVIMNDRTYYESASKSQRRCRLLKQLRIIDHLISQLLKVIASEATAFDFLDESHLSSSIRVIGRLARVHHSYNIFQDRLRVGQIQQPKTGSSSSNPFNRIMEKSPDMQVRCWILLYKLLKEAATQRPSMFPDVGNDLVQLLFTVHRALGARRVCEASKKSFLILMKNELLAYPKANYCDVYLSQVIFDLHDLRLASSFQYENHGCDSSPMKKATAFQLMDFVMMLAQKSNLKELIKTELKTALDAMQQVIRHPPPCNATSLNIKRFNAFIKSSIHPVILYRCLRGGEVFSTVSPVRTEYTSVVEKGWYFLLANINLTKFRSQKRVSPVPTLDLDVAHALFRTEISFNSGNWETWYRLAQVYDSMLEEIVIWSAEKMNTNNGDLIKHQRAAIHCYTVAASASMFVEDPSFETNIKISNLLHDFGMRIYASSRPPFFMEAFSLADFQKYFSGQGGGTYTASPHPALTDFQAWRFASDLFERALVDNPNYWLNHYMLAKCQWKILNRPENHRNGGQFVTLNDVVGSITKAIESLPEKKDIKQQPILEPHYKLVSFLHKMVMKKMLPFEKAAEFMEATPFCKDIVPPNDLEDWQSYVVGILRALSNADKSNWHHRILYRTALILYDGKSNTESAALAAKTELNQQIFTKTLALQVWRPEHERAGRHFVFTSEYMRYFVRILKTLQDRSAIEALLRRLRRKPGEFLNHKDLWTDMSDNYIELIRDMESIPEGYEDVMFRYASYDSFIIASETLESWAEQSQVPLLILLRDVLEFKKLGAGILKTLAVDQLIADIYASIYEKQVPLLFPVIWEAISDFSDWQMCHSRISLNMQTANPAPSDGAPAQPDASLPTGASTGIIKPPNRKVVTRRDVMRKAETIITKLAALLQPLSAARNAKPAEASLAPQDVVAEQVFAPAEEAEAEPKNDADLSDAGSLHDSADDEIETWGEDESLRQSGWRPVLPENGARSPDWD